MVGSALLALPALLLSLSVAASPLRLQKREPVPAFVLQNAPLLHLAANEEFGLSDVAVHIQHVVPRVNYASVAPSVTLQTLSSFGPEVFLTSKDDVTDSPKADWLRSQYGKPDANGLSGAPATIVLVNKPNGVLDAFFFSFFSFNDGGKVCDRSVSMRWSPSLARHRSSVSRLATTSAIGSTPWCAS